MQSNGTATISRIRRKRRRAQLASDLRLVQAAVDRELVEAVHGQAQKAKHTMRKIVTWGLEEYLLHTSPDVARELRIRTTGSR